MSKTPSLSYIKIIKALQRNGWTMVQQRRAAHVAKNWPEADVHSDQIAAAVYEVEDTPEGPREQRKQ